MKYHYEKPENYRIKHGEVYVCDHILYNKCTLYKSNGLGLAVVQKRYNPRLKVFWWGPIDPWLIDDIFNADRFDEYFKNRAGCKDEFGVYPTISVRKIMWALKMRPLPKEPWDVEI